MPAPFLLPFTMTETLFQNNGGYTKISNNVLRAIYRSPFNGTEIRVIIFVIRMTSGWHKESKLLSYGYIAKETNLNKRNVKRAINLLIQAKVIIKSKDGRKNKLALNQNLTTWQLWKTSDIEGAKLPLLKG